MRRARLLACIIGEYQEIPVYAGETSLIQLWGEFSCVAHFVVAALRILKHTGKQAPRRRDIVRSIVENFDAFFCHARSVEQFMSETQIKKASQPLGNSEHMVRVESFYPHMVDNAPNLEILGTDILLILENAPKRMANKNCSKGRALRFLKDNKLWNDATETPKNELVINFFDA